MKERKIQLPDSQIPTSWYNIIPDLPAPLPPPLHPKTGQPTSLEDLQPIFPDAVLEQEVNTDRWIPIPEDILNILSLWRPTPLYRAYNLEKALDTPAKIYYKYEGVSPAGSHKPNTSVAQAYYNMKQGIKRITTETGAGQWGSALSFACSFFDVECMVYMVKCSFYQKPYRRVMMQTWGGNCIPSPSDKTAAGRAVLAEDPECPGSLGIAISEAVEDAVQRDDTKYSLGSVLNHVMLHQTVIGLEVIDQLKLVDAYPDVLIGCCGGGSNFAGLVFPFIPEKAAGKDIRIIAVEPAACPTLTKGIYAYDYGDKSGMTPLLKMDTLGHDFIPPGIHAGGLRYHGMAPLVSLLHQEGVIESQSLHQLKCFEAAVTFARSEGIIVAPETSHAVASAVDEALKAKEEGKEKTILFCLSGHGHLDLAAYEKYFANELHDYEYPMEKIHEAQSHLPKL
jgi:tryptophan synthase beta chain